MLCPLPENWWEKDRRTGEEQPLILAVQAKMVVGGVMAQTRNSANVGEELAVGGIVNLALMVVVAVIVIIPLAPPAVVFMAMLIVQRLEEITEAALAPAGFVAVM